MIVWLLSLCEFSDTGTESDAQGRNTAGVLGILRAWNGTSVHISPGEPGGFCSSFVLPTLLLLFLGLVLSLPQPPSLSVTHTHMHTH